MTKDFGSLSQDVLHRMALCQSCSVLLGYNAGPLDPEPSLLCPKCFDDLLKRGD